MNLLTQVSKTGDEIIEGLKTFRRFIVRKSNGAVIIKAGDGFDGVEIGGDLTVSGNITDENGNPPSQAITDTNDKFVATTVDGAFDELGETKNWNGFDLQDPDSMGTLTWDNSTKKISLAVKSGETSFHFWVDGKKQTSTATITSGALPATSGTYYFYLDSDGDMQYILEASVSMDMFYKYAIVALVYWNETASYGMPYEERHGYRMSSADHEMEHMTIGARYASGLALTGLVDAASTFTGANSGKYYDEDIPHSISAATTMPFLYRLGADAEWTWTTADNNVGYKNGGSYATWNEYTGGAWQLTQADYAHDYILIFVVAQKTLSGYTEFAKIIDQAGYSSRSKARDAIEGAKKLLILDGLPSPEMVFIGVYICRKTGVLEDLADGSVYLDLRGSSSRGSGGDSAATNLAADTVVDASGFSGNLSTTDTDVQTVAETIDANLVGSSLTATVGSGGDYSTLPTAINALIKYKQAQAGSEILATINILTGTTITTGVGLYNCDCSWMKITSTDATVTVTVSAVFLKAYSSKLPQISAKFDMDGDGTHGLQLMDGSFVKVAANCGVINAGSDGIYLENSQAEIDSTIFTGAGLNGIDARYCSRVSARSADASGATGYGVQVTYASILDFSSGDASNCVRGIDVSAGSTVCAHSATATGCSGFGLHVTGSQCEAYNIDVSGCTGTNGIYCGYGGNIDATNANAQMGASPASTDVTISYGATISAVGVTGGLCTTANAVTNKGIIYN